MLFATPTCDLWDERSCVKWVVLVVRWAEIREMSCVSCEMSGVVWDELCELWDELCERTWVKFSERTRSSSTKCHTKAALERVELCEMSWVRWVVWDELCDLWDERSCVRWNVCIVWDNLSEVERERSNSGGEGGEGKEYKHKNKSPTQRCEEKNHNLMSCVMMLKKARRRIMLQSYNDKITQQKRAQTTNRLTCTDDPLLTCTDDPPTSKIGQLLSHSQARFPVLWIRANWSPSNDDSGIQSERWGWAWVQLLSLFLDYQCFFLRRKTGMVC